MSLDEPATKTHLLILRGVFPNMCTPVKAVPREARKETIFTPLPKRFTSVDAWPKNTNLKCWDCDRIPKGYPRFVALNPAKDENGADVCDTHGNFCEWNCAVHFIKHEFPSSQQSDLVESTLLFESKFSKLRKVKILDPPSKTCMRQYCGDDDGLSEAEYQTKIDALNSNYTLNNYKLVQLTEL